MARYTGLSERFVDLNNCGSASLSSAGSCSGTRARTVGRFDSRYLGIVENAGGSSPEFDPSLAAVRPAYTATFNQYVRADLEYKSDMPYHILGGLVGDWDWGGSGRATPRRAVHLRAAMAKNPHMKVLVASGYYDLATPLRRDRIHPGPHEARPGRSPEHPGHDLRGRPHDVRPRAVAGEAQGGRLAVP